ncbi:Thyrotropin-releasing hormone receptor [Echinococcus granulosus]|uniref:Thyrotropin-releasing hormone receptor n=1 Tax=Echinococcus granulosus TaxID=6210 RepID=W6U8F5_ECHGR|nr:Thyrotropin-releasing hormone receptor [Echinococcus granulosus]XP_024348699.1 Thyrotropin-releasing hormone receptor [Echinococcus granulosus]EUB57501.1 Thyrotropin-releasing hormone receptor [Echinococcus granulosus]EUB57503.1 Thyrotropin-releasing hormone receptor [Echinococcus granulosus]
MDYNISLSTSLMPNSSQYINLSVRPAIYYSLPYRLLGTIAATLILIVGLSGNLLVITVITWSSKMRSPTNCYLVSLSFSDMLFLLHATAPFIWELYVMIGQWTLGTHACRIIVAMQYLCVDTSALSMAAFSVERWVAICHPMRAQTLCTVNRALKIIAGIWIFCAAYNCVWLFTLDTQVVEYVYGTYRTCTYKFSRMRYSTVYLLDFILFYTLPLGLIFVMYTQITLRLFKFHKSICLNLNKGKSESNRNAVVKMLMAVVILFAVFWFPYRTLVVYNSFVTPKRTDYWLILFVKTMAYLNSTVNPILYNAMSKKFRRAFRLLITQTSCFGRQSKMNSVLGSRRTECIRSRDYFRHVQQQRHQLSRTVANLTQANESQALASNNKNEALAEG